MSDADTEAKTDEKTDNAAATANAPDSAAAKATGKHIPEAPKTRTAKPRKAKVQDGAEGQFKEPGSTLNPSDPEAPNYRFEAANTAASLAGDQSIDQGTGVQPPAAGLGGLAEGTSDSTPGLRWGDDLGPRGRVISVTKGGSGGPTTTYEETLPAGASDEQAAAAKERLHRRFLAA